MTNDPTSTEFIGSHEKAKNGFGQNGAQNASSDLPGEHTTSGFLPQAKVPPGLDPQDQLGSRVHVVDGKPTAYKTTAGLGERSVDSGSPGGKIPKSTNHAAKR